MGGYSESNHGLARRFRPAQFRKESIDIVRRGENGEGDTGEIDDIGAFHRPAQVIRIGRQLPCGGGVAPVAEGAFAILEVDQVETGRAALDAADFFRAYAGIRDEGEHVFRERIVAERGEIINGPIFGQAGARIPGGIEGITGKTLRSSPLPACDSSTMHSPIDRNRPPTPSSSRFSSHAAYDERAPLTRAVLAVCACAKFRFTPPRWLYILLPDTSGDCR